MDYLLPASVYQPPSRPGRRRHLNTIIEDNEDTSYAHTSESEEVWSDSTVTGRPAALATKYFVQRPHQDKHQVYVTLARGPPSTVSSDCDEEETCQHSGRNSYADSDVCTVFSDSSCPSLTGSHTSDATTFMTASNRSSIISRSSRNKLSLLIPRNSWNSLEGDVKSIAFGMSPSTKIKLSSEILDRLPKSIPAFEAEPSLADGSSIRSESPCVAAITSAPVTPDLHNLEIIEGQSWGHQQQPLSLTTPLEIAIDENHSLILSPAEAHSNVYSATGRSSTNWTDIIGNFPDIPGAVPLDMTPVTPSIPRREVFNRLASDSGVQLPEEALQVLQNLNGPHYAESLADSLMSGQEQEMKECSAPRSRPRSMNDKSPISEYSEFSQLTIPSPGGFFSSLKAGARRTWAPPSRKTSPPPPSSTTAENFYNMPWAQPSQLPSQLKETVIECDDDTDDMDGPPTVKQAMFDLGISAPKEDEDMYGSGHAAGIAHEYEEAYEDGLKQAAEAHKDRTSDWLAAQTTYLSALRETNPVNDPADFSAAISPRVGDCSCRKDSMESDDRKVVRFLEQAKAATSPADGVSRTKVSSPPKEAMFLEAFTYQRSETKRSDVFLHASARLGSVQATRIALPHQHVQSLLNTHNSTTLESSHTRPKYRGPFSQNPRNTGDFTPTAEQAEFRVLERQQNALNAIKPSLWSLEAQRTILYNGRLLANNAASEKLTKRDAEFVEPSEKSEKTKKRRPRVLDLGGAATASWAWSAATKWPNVKVYTVQSKQQTELAKRYSGMKEDNVEAPRPETPRNHKVISVPHFWQLPFNDNHFDIISARTLHMYLRANPVPGVDSIDEWDLTLKECMRVLKPGGILDFFMMDSGISNASGKSGSNAVNLSPSNMAGLNGLPTEESESASSKCRNLNTELKCELQRRGYEIDGGCGRLMSRLKKRGFVSVKRQWLGLPMGRSNTPSAAMRIHSRNASSSSAVSNYASHFQADGTRKPASFRAAPRPISEVSTISKLINQYSSVEAVQGPIGSTTDVADMSALLGELLWEEWLVRLRIESGKYTPENVLDGVEETFGEWRRSGKAAWRGAVGWARKPTKKEAESAAQAKSKYISPVDVIDAGFHQDFAIATSFLSSSPLATKPYSAPAGIQRQASVRHSRTKGSLSASAGLTIDTAVARRRSTRRFSSALNEVRTADYTFSAVERGEVGEIPMMILH